MKIKHINKIEIIIFFLFIGLLYGCKKDEAIIITDDETDFETKEIQSESINDNLIYVYITGAIKNPGVYTVEKESRIYQVIELAGGFLEGADERNINLADKVSDGMKIVVYSVNESVNISEENNSNENQIININTATKEQLMMLPGIGESKAESIIRYRQDYGFFKSIDEIMNISGIKEGAFDKIKDLIKI